MFNFLKKKSRIDTVGFPARLLASDAEYVKVEYAGGDMAPIFDPTSDLARDIQKRVGLDITVPSSKQGGTSPKAKIIGLLETLSSPCNLRQLRLGCIFERIDVSQANAFSKLTHISITGSPELDDCVSILSQCTNAVEAEFTMMRVPPYDTDPGYQGSGVRTCLPKLRSLTIVASSDVEAFLPHFDCPGLHRLLVSNGPIDLPLANGQELRVSRYHFPAIQAFLSRCPELKQVIIVNNIRWLYAQGYFNLEVLKKVPQVEIRAFLPQSQDRKLPSNKLGEGGKICKHNDQAIVHVRVGKGITEIGKLLDPTWEPAFWNTVDGMQEWVMSD